jgi:hypothetical protein|tara:strand:+ start:10053 stop:10391 length:339 start_codon:yes stop_codon:yes gene_type:complete
MKRPIILALFCFLVSCKTEISKPRAPKDVLSKKEMVSLTKDLLLMESNIELSYGQVATYYKILNSSTDVIFKKHQISRERYTRSFDYFAADQDKMTALYQEILDSLNIESLK